MSKKKKPNKRIEDITTQISDLKYSFGNPRKTNKIKQEIESLKKSIKQFGTWRSIGIDENNNVIFGNKLSMALKELGIQQTSAKRLIGYTNAELKAINIKDNEHVGEWDFDLKFEWEKEIRIEMPSIDFNIVGIQNRDKYKDKIDHYNDEFSPNLCLEKLGNKLYLIKYLQKFDKSIELYAGRGQLSSYYNIIFKKNIKNDQQKYCDFNYKAIDFIEKKLGDNIDFDLIDFDDEGTPALELKHFFKIIKIKKNNFILSITDGLPMALKIKSNIDFKKYFDIEIDKNERFDKFESIYVDFINKLAEDSGFKVEDKCICYKKNKNVLYLSFFLKKHFNKSRSRTSKK